MACRYNITKKVEALYAVEWPMGENEKMLRSKLKRGTRVRLRPDLLLYDGRIRAGQTGTYNQTSTGTPSVRQLSPTSLPPAPSIPLDPRTPVPVLFCGI